MGFLGVDAYKNGNKAITKHSAKWLKSKYAELILGLVAFVESVFAPIIIDPFLIALVLASPHRWKRYVFISIVASVIGGVCAYALGALFFETLGVKIISMYSLEKPFAGVSENLNNNGFAFVFIGAFTPFSYKLVAIASGLLKINLLTFIVASVIGRILRLGLVGMATSKFGPHALPTVRKNIYIVATIAGFVFCLYILLKFI